MVDQLPLTYQGQVIAFEVTLDTGDALFDLIKMAKKKRADAKWKMTLAALRCSSEMYSARDLKHWHPAATESTPTTPIHD
jgi:hypothetical protein